jgi:hypothetical protein
VHAVIAHAFSAELRTASLIAAPACALAGLALRWRAKYTTTVILYLICIGVFTFIYEMGLAFPVAFLFFVRRSDLVPWVLPALCIGLGGLVAWRIQVSFRRDWSGPVEHAPGVRLRGNTLDRVAVQRNSRLTVSAGILLAVCLIGVFLLRGGAVYATSLFLVIPLLLTVVCIDPLAELVTFYCVFRRIERARSKRYELPPLKRTE